MKDWIPPLLAAYAAMYGCAKAAEVELKFTTTALAVARRAGSAWRVTEESARQIHGEHLIPQVQRGLVGVPTTQYPGGVDQYVQSPESRNRLTHNLDDGTLVTDIDDEGVEAILRRSMFLPISGCSPTPARRCRQRPRGHLRRATAARWPARFQILRR